MTFFSFLDATYRLGAIEQATEFTVSTNARVKMATWLIQQQYRFYCVVQVFRLVAEFFAVNLGLKAAPVSPLGNEKPRKAQSEPSEQVLPN